MIEYPFPLLPGDAIIVFGTSLVLRQGWSAAGVLAAVMLGSAVGLMAVYAFGRGLAARGHCHPSVEKIVARFSRHGSLYLGINRFLPSVRALFFIAAGMARLSPWKVLFWGLVSAAAWNGMLLGLAVAVGANWERLETLLIRYSEIAWGALGLVTGVALLRWWLRKRRAP
jgi:membrane protein DedA with SNARE-associated domain